MKHPAVRRIDWPALVKRSANIKPVARAMTAKLEAAGEDIVASGVLEQLRNGERYAD